MSVRAYSGAERTKSDRVSDPAMPSATHLAALERLSTAEAGSTRRREPTQPPRQSDDLSTLGPATQALMLPSGLA